MRVHVSYALCLFDSLGLTVNPKKSVLFPTQEIEFLGVILNSEVMTSTLTSRKKDRIKAQGLLLLDGVVSLHSRSSFIGMAVASDPAVELAPLRYKYLEIVRNRELSFHHGDYSALVLLDHHARELVAWWVDNVHTQVKSLRSCPYQLEMFCDASLTGWGAVAGIVRTGGHWAHDELDHIYCLELKAIFSGLHSLYKDSRDTHIRVHSDNATAIACLERHGSIKLNLNSLVEQKFFPGLSRGA